MKKKQRKVFKPIVRFFRRLTLKRVKGVIPVSGGLVNAINDIEPKELSDIEPKKLSNYFKKVMVEFKKDVEKSGAVGDWHELYKSLKHLSQVERITDNELKQMDAHLNNYIKGHEHNKASASRYSIALRIQSILNYGVTNIRAQKEQQSNQQEKESIILKKGSYVDEDEGSIYAKSLKTYVDNINKNKNAEINVVNFIQYLENKVFTEKLIYKLDKNHLNWNDAYKALQSFSNYRGGISDDFKSKINDDIITVKKFISGRINIDKDAANELLHFYDKISKLKVPTYNKNDTLAECLEKCKSAMDALRKSISASVAKTESGASGMYDVESLIEKLDRIEKNKRIYAMDIMHIQDDLEELMDRGVEDIIYACRIPGADIDTEKEDKVRKKVDAFLKGTRSFLDSVKRKAQELQTQFPKNAKGTKETEHPDSPKNPSDTWKLGSNPFDD